MKVYDGIHSFHATKGTIVTIGTFDGVHVGHQKILNRLVKIAAEEARETVLLTFWPHPRLVLNPDSPFKLLNTLDEKASLLEKIGIDHFVKINFTTKFAQLSSEEFIQKILVEKLHTKKLIIGYNHRFGKNREGSFKYLKQNEAKFNFEIEEIPRLDVDEVGVSSTIIRESITSGDVQTASQYLGKPYIITGTVIKGNRKGRTIGFPTANIFVKESYKLIPKIGSYAVTALWQGKTLKGMLNIGKRPTVNGNDLTVEVHFFDFNESIYGDPLTIFFKKRLRDETKFKDLQALRTQLIKDKKQTLEILG